MRFPQICRFRGQLSRGEAPGVTCPLLVLLVLLVQPTLLACPVCFQVEQNSTTHGLQAAVLVLIGVTTGVLMGFGLFIVRLVRRS